MKINILCDDENSWFWEKNEDFVKGLSNKGHQVSLSLLEKELLEGDLGVFISCTKLVSKEGLSKNSYNIVCHPSDLPEGKGFAPIAWRILDNKNDITFTLFEANEKIDDGDYYFKKNIELTGNELNDEIRQIQADTTFDLINEFVSNFPKNDSFPQEGIESFNSKRNPEDSELDINKTIDEQFNLLRIVDNEKYPAFFIRNGIKYKIKIEKYL